MKDTSLKSLKEVILNYKAKGKKGKGSRSSWSLGRLRTVIQNWTNDIGANKRAIDVASNPYFWQAFLYAVAKRMPMGFHTKQLLEEIKAYILAVEVEPSLLQNPHLKYTDTARIEDPIGDRLHADEYAIAVTKSQAERITICKKAVCLVDKFCVLDKGFAAREALYTVIGALVCGEVGREEV